VNLGLTKERYDSALSQTTTGKKVINFSDSPSDAAMILALKNQSGQITQFERNIAAGLSMLKPAEASIDSSVTLMYRAISLAEQGASETNTGDAREILADEIDQVRDQLLNYANSEVQGKYLFAGANTLTPPFVKDPATGDITYMGNGEEVKIQADFTIQVATNVPGDQVFTGSVDIFQRLADLRDALRADDTAAISTAISSMDDVVNQLDQALGTIGSATSHLNDITAQLKSYQSSLTSRISSLEDANSAAAISNLSAAEVSLQATLKAGSTIFQNSLMDYLS